ncbi:acetylornithine deacetylase or succinyl-diaminopimelate desuccinylase [Ancylobacter novellus DSM 506]|uniref:Probable succinyl-diaminopimelate desuccinylase n=1 Tax=Ancylobacter novellus (strain ATCC 8093 / DSM 506 / JCM 20403 / CCM 1077 / IAM 12100 / NBRC 12443 / NCIMB 10456) TaxID=639283 RepID=D7AAL4_ANCN5|nr:ArgE/DapE family deacylase [Ancylobacter novellus]ADH89017.1 acetylornithine deacetylase or succinyl-diaminopimelate desuccinylase [Ancylobacter novellus DSM 506]
MSIPGDDSERLDATQALQVEFLKALVRVPSDNPPGDCAPHAEVAARLLEELGFTVERHPVPEPFVKTYGMKSVVNLVVRERFGTGKGPVIALNAHGDVVPPGEGWTFDPYGAEEKGGAIYGRGAAVSKSDFATYAFALLGLKQRPEGLDGTVELHFTYDEEAGGFVGPKWLIEHDLTKPDYAISAGFSYAVVVAHNGALHLEIVVRGKQAHAAMPETGADALEAATAILSAIYGERRRLTGIVSATPGIGSPKITVGLISGGINTNVVPDRIVMRVDRRLTPEEDGTSVEAGLNALVEAAVGGMPGIDIECRRIILAEPLRTLPGTEKLVETIQKHASEVLGETPPATAVPLYTDARHYTAAGVPTVLYGAGPRSILEANAHAADEHVQIRDLKAATQVIEATLRDLLRAE